ncbi:hypothetical protein ACEQPO_28045 [Bacillus sp. SL00103]
MAQWGRKDRPLFAPISDAKVKPGTALSVTDDKLPVDQTNGRWPHDILCTEIGEPI